MKLYVLPVEKICNASCNFCITNFRETSNKEFLDINCLVKILDDYSPNSIEITGGGEPLLHRNIGDIANICIERARTQIYTNGVLYRRVEGVKGLEFLSVSRAHYKDSINERIMGVKYNIEDIFNLDIPIKLSLLLLKSGISFKKEIVNYLDWAGKNNVKKVIVRQLFDHDYRGKIEGEFVSTADMARSFASHTGEENVCLKWNGMDVEFETRSCACEFNNPVLHADGKLYKGWSREVIHDLDGS